MNPSTPEQLARLLDQIRGSYPNGIPLAALQSESKAVTLAVPAYQFIIVGSPDSLSPAAQELLLAITSKGLKISQDQYTVSYTSELEVEAFAAASTYEHVIVFGSSRKSGSGEREDGRTVLYSGGLEDLRTDTGMKKELWRGLQALL